MERISFKLNTKETIAFFVEIGNRQVDDVDTAAEELNTEWGNYIQINILDIISSNAIAIFFLRLFFIVERMCIQN